MQKRIRKAFTKAFDSQCTNVTCPNLFKAQKALKGQGITVASIASAGFPEALYMGCAGSYSMSPDVPTFAPVDSEGKVCCIAAVWCDLVFLLTLDAAGPKRSQHRFSLFFESIKPHSTDSCSLRSSLIHTHPFCPFLHRKTSLSSPAWTTAPET